MAILKIILFIAPLHRSCLGFAIKGTEALGLAPILIIDKSSSRTCLFVYLFRILGPCLVLNYWKL